MAAHIGETRFSFNWRILIFFLFFVELISISRRLTKAKVLVVKVLRRDSIRDTTLNSKDNIVKQVVLHKLFEAVKLFFSVEALG